MSLMHAVREEGLRLFDFLARIRWQDLHDSLDGRGDDVPDPDPKGDEEGGEDDESDDDRSGSSRRRKRRHKRSRLQRAGAKDPVVDSTAKVQGWLAHVIQPEGPGAAPGAEDLPPFAS
ncbi:uncharacterized protein SPPG_01199 [Spizellomyces punctatus DAOM BR117]|uniref:Uncharacterized protein n=1 Tax=Spizellomyces punctatus (strain DAOM BR117) TaxID=645134 RepID=A0A0L0HQT1_SPIPD|nr:uncharacterized protein SPPG_01199 [Spizellomyces punctatus DAOM BR117]KND03741.1 hypothetical protein SPPG_01199 [Spizellomyces punctatus DAOM BR117]|eukprot:XP_016611780.1 hypothetical protein SPPG_01199 [Spizellomyces punctatus DAOM BR117]